MKSAKDLIAKLFDKQTGVLAERYSSLFSGWKQIAGIDIAAHSAVKELENGTLVVEVDHPGWVQMIRLKERGILLSIQKRYPELDIRMIKLLTIGGDIPRSDGAAESLSSPSRRPLPPTNVPEVEELRERDSAEYREFQSLLDRLKKMKSRDNRER